MRTRARLIEVMESVNDDGAGIFTRCVALRAASALRSGFMSASLSIDLKVIADGSPSPHIRELAAEALHYLNEDANG